ncbi:hypothetical protein PR048_029158 [Dryococelus australis]|uniref:Secreted protein n=1 Tax=Dryococelus australis TaxID=614101 RepID=A0ABQ9GF46_9NEOP|nr:hypothetical protein PR048_029158 [Dryococelus australis]
MQPQWAMWALSVTKIVVGCETIRNFQGFINASGCPCNGGLMQPLVHAEFDNSWRTMAQSSPSTVTAVNQWTVGVGIFVRETVESSLQILFYITILNYFHSAATMAERLACSLPTNRFRVQSPAGSLRIFAFGNRAGR